MLRASSSCFDLLISGMHCRERFWSFWIHMSWVVKDEILCFAHIMGAPKEEETGKI